MSPIQRKSEAGRKKQKQVKEKQSPEKAPMGRPARKWFDADRERVKLAVSVGYQDDQIAALLGTSEATLKRHFAAELACGRAEVHLRVAQQMLTQALAGDVTAAIWWTKAQMGWKETTRNEHTGRNGQPLEFKKALRLKEMNAEEWLALRKKFMSSASSAPQKRT